MRSLIYFERDNANVVLNLRTDLPYDCEGKTTARYPLSWKCSCPADAELLRHYLDSRLDNTLAKLAKKYYDMGWRNAKEKSKRMTEFNCPFLEEP